MIVERTMDSHWLANTWLLADRDGGQAVVIDTGGPMGPIVETIRKRKLTLTHVLCTHHHPDHVAHNADYRDEFGCVVCGHGAERTYFGELDRELVDGEELQVGALSVRAVHIPGHTVGQLGFVVDGGRCVFTGDTLFRGSVGGTRGRAHTTLEDLRESIMDVLLRLPGDCVVYPGHMEETTIAQEARDNAFVRAWRAGRSDGVDCEAFGRAAKLLLRAADYDGGSKCWVRWEDGTEDVVPGSRVSER